MHVVEVASILCHDISELLDLCSSGCWVHAVVSDSSMQLYMIITRKGAYHLNLAMPNSHMQ